MDGGVDSEAESLPETEDQDAAQASANAAFSRRSTGVPLFGKKGQRPATTPGKKAVKKGKQVPSMPRRAEIITPTKNGVWGSPRRKSYKVKLELSAECATKAPSDIDVDAQPLSTTLGHADLDHWFYDFEKVASGEIQKKEINRVIRVLTVITVIGVI